MFFVGDLVASGSLVMILPVVNDRDVSHNKSAKRRMVNISGIAGRVSTIC